MKEAPMSANTDTAASGKRRCPVCGRPKHSYQQCCETCWVDGNWRLWLHGRHLKDRHYMAGTRNTYEDIMDLTLKGA